MPEAHAVSSEPCLSAGGGQGDREAERPSPVGWAQAAASRTKCGGAVLPSVKPFS